MSGSNRDALRRRCHGLSLGLFAGGADVCRTAATAADWGCEILHFDIMDGVFLPAYCGGPDVVAAIETDMLRDVHLMMQNPSDHVGAFADAGADIITVHAEADDPAAALRAIRSSEASLARPIMAGLCLLPDTSVADAAALFELQPDLVLVAALDPRSKEPADISRACRRVNKLRTSSAPSGPVIAFDGGVTTQNIAEIAAARPDIVVAGSAVFKADVPEATFRAMDRTVAQS